MSARASGRSLLLMVGTSKGLFLYHSDRDRQTWRVEGPFLDGLEVNHATFDRRTGAVYATANSPWFGSRLAYSRDMGKTWQESRGLGFSPESGLKLDRLWHIEPGRPSEPGVVYCGVAPAALFRSDDGGETWEEVTGLTSHPSRPDWQPGAGGLCLHTIVLDPVQSGRMWVAISSAGAFRTDDGGLTWQAVNKNLRRAEMEAYPEWGQCVHDVVLAAGGNSRLYLRNHSCVYRSDDGADTWQDITAGLPSDFGFPIAAHPRDPDTAYVIPLQNADFRCPPEGKLRVFRAQDAGRTWQPLSRGLPQRGAYMGIYREGLCTDELEPAGVYFGTNTGHLYVSADEGDRWRRLTATLPPIYSVSAAVLN